MEKNTFLPINAQDGDLLPVSAFKGIEDGTWEQGTRYPDGRLCPQPGGEV